MFTMILVNADVVYLIGEIYKLAILFLSHVLQNNRPQIIWLVGWLKNSLKSAILYWGLVIYIRETV